MKDKITQQEPLMSQEALEALIEKYFECSATEDEEQCLRWQLRHTLLHSPAIDECMATMGYFAYQTNVAKSDRLKVRRYNGRRILRMAAAIALVVTVAVSFYRTHSSQSGCVAYVNGERIDNDAQVMVMMRSDMSDVNQASQSIDNNMMQQLGSIGEALDD